MSIVDRKWRVSAVLAVLVAAGLWLAQSSVLAHPLAQGSIVARVLADRLELDVRVPFEEIVIASTAKSGQAPASLEAGLKEHGDYLLAHLTVELDGKAVSGKCLKWEQGKTPTDQHVTFMLSYDFQAGTQPSQLKLSEDVLHEIEYAPGNPWEVSYVVSLTHASGATEQGMLLTTKQPFQAALNWGAESGAATTQTSGWNTFSAFCYHGIMHILTGYDHLLFIASLVLAARKFMDLFKVVATFTVAHGVTLTLSVLNIVRLSDRIVEPMIAASIVYVALENIFFPQRSRNWTRLASAFFFGLFHGLGFAGGLLEAMEGMPGTAIAIALIAFSVGVELGHQAVVIPLYGTVTLIRRAQKSDVAREEVSDHIRKFASVAITLAGLFYFVMALRLV